MGRTPGVRAMRSRRAVSDGDFGRCAVGGSEAGSSAGEAGTGVAGSEIEPADELERKKVCESRFRSDGFSAGSATGVEGVMGVAGSRPSAGGGAVTVARLRTGGRAGLGALGGDDSEWLESGRREASSILPADARSSEVLAEPKGTMWWERVMPRLLLAPQIGRASCRERVS